MIVLYTISELSVVFCPYSHWNANFCLQWRWLLQGASHISTRLSPKTPQNEVYDRNMAPEQWVYWISRCDTYLL